MQSCTMKHVGTHSTQLTCEQNQSVVRDKLLPTGGSRARSISFSECVRACKSSSMLRNSHLLFIGGKEGRGWREGGITSIESIHTERLNGEWKWMNDLCVSCDRFLALKQFCVLWFKDVLVLRSAALGSDLLFYWFVGECCLCVHS